MTYSEHTTETKEEPTKGGDNVMADATEHIAEERVSIELVDAGGHKDRVVMVLSKVKGLTMPAEQLVRHIPCTVATDVPLSLAEKLKQYLEKAGAMVMLEREQTGAEEEELFAADEFPLADESPAEDAFPESPGIDDEDAVLEFEAAPAPDMDAPPDFETDDDLAFATSDMAQPPDFPDDGDSLPDTAPKGGGFGKFLSKLSTLGKQHAPEATGAGETSAPKTALRQFIEKFRKPKASLEEKSASASAEFAEPIKRKTPDLLTSPVAYILVGVLAGAILAGIWGSWGIQKQRQKLVDYEIQTAQQIEAHSAQLKNLVAQLTQKVESLQQENVTLQGELDAAQQRPTGILPTDSPLTMRPSEETLVHEFQALKERHAQILEDSYAAQQQAGCSQQVLLDGKGTVTYAQVVKHFSARSTRLDVRRSDSLLTPYIAEFKIPFQQEIRTGATPQACEAVTLQTFDLPDHHEFGGYYGIWVLEYAYKDGAWVLNRTVIERNRDLYANAFQKGSPEYAKFTIDKAAFPGLGE